AVAADQRQVARSRRVRHHRHRRDRREAGYAVGAVGFRGVDIRRRDDFIHFIPARPHETTEAATLFVAARALGVFHDGSPGIDGVAVLLAHFAPQPHQRAAHLRIFEAIGAVDIPGVAGATRTTARFVIGQIGARARIIGLLRLPGDEAVLDVDLPAASAGTVD